MKLILTQEIEGLGTPGDIVEVKDGYGRNYLVPRGLAIGWTKGAEKQIHTIRRARDARAIKGKEHATEVKNQLERLAVKLDVKAGEKGRLFGSVTPADVAGAIKASGGPLVERRAIEIAAPIKTTGKHEVSVQLHPEVAATVNLEVVAG
jgi:large subunit ribosomal protein L9